VQAREPEDDAGEQLFEASARLRADGGTHAQIAVDDLDARKAMSLRRIPERVLQALAFGVVFNLSERRLA
jgi:hypothetical protein